MSDKPVSYSDVMRELSNMVGEYFENIEDVEAYCAELRGGSDQNKLTDLRAELAAKDAEIERLRKSLALVDDALSSYAEFYWRAAGLAGLPDDALPSTQTDNIILSKIAEHDEIERLRGDLKKITDIGGYWDMLGILTLDEAKVFDEVRRALEAK